MKCIWLIDDDPINNLICETLILTSGLAAEVIAYESGEAGLTALSTATSWPDLLLLDLNMPQLDGWSLLDALKILPDGHKLPVVILTSSIYERDKVRAKTYSQVLDFLSKPLDLTSLGVILARCMNEPLANVS